LDDVLENAFEEYLAANRRFAQTSLDIEAVQAGRDAAMRGRTEDTAPAFQRLSAQDVHHPVFRNPKLTARKQKGHFCGHFSRVVVSDFRSLRGDMVLRPLLARLSPAAKIPFQTRRRKVIQRPFASRQSLTEPPAPLVARRAGALRTDRKMTLMTLRVLY
jgi:hypothetical protein